MRSVLTVLVALAVTPVAWGADGEPKKALTSKGNATARSVVLKRGDLSSAFTMRTRPDDDLPKGVRCGALDESDLTITGEAQSPDFQLSQPGLFVTIGSTTNVYRSLGEAGKSWKRGTSAQTTTCLADIVRLSAPPGQRVSIVSAKRLTFPKVAPDDRGVPRGRDADDRREPASGRTSTRSSSSTVGSSRASSSRPSDAPSGRPTSSAWRRSSRTGWPGRTVQRARPPDRGLDVAGGSLGRVRRTPFGVPT